MPSAIIVPDGFAFVGAALMSLVYLAAWQSMQVGKARKAAGIAYPQMYAEKTEQESSRAALVFNCTQRAHQNTLEILPLMAIATLVAGVTMPIPAAALCGTFVVGRVLYHFGYVTGDPSKRFSRGGYLYEVGALGLLLASTYSTYTLVRSAL